jgi:hypothetical protein
LGVKPRTTREEHGKNSDPGDWGLSPFWARLEWGLTPVHFRDACWNEMSRIGYWVQSL